MLEICVPDVIYTEHTVCVVYVCLIAILWIIVMPTLIKRNDSRELNFTAYCYHFYYTTNRFAAHHFK